MVQGEDGGGELWVLRPGARIPVEGELRKIITPDAWCTHESMKRGILHLKDAGLGTQAVLAQVPQDRLRLMFEALPPSPVRFCPDPFSPIFCDANGGQQLWVDLESKPSIATY